MHINSFFPQMIHIPFFMQISFVIEEMNLLLQLGIMISWQYSQSTLILSIVQLFFLKIQEGKIQNL